jgi:hypothetical protein
MKTYGGLDVQTHVFLTSALVEGEWSVSLPGRFTPGERAPDTHRTGSWEGPRAGLDGMEKWKFLTLPGFEPLPHGRAAQCQSLYCLRYPGSNYNIQNLISFMGSVFVFEENGSEITPDFYSK